MPGVIPKRTEELSRARDANRNGRPPVTHGELREVTWKFKPDPNWHDIAKKIYEAVANSGQSDFYQDSDWAVLYSICEDISYYKTPRYYTDKKTGEQYEGKRSGQMLQSIMSSLQSLLLTEGDRRRVRLELQKPPEEKTDLKVVGLDKYRNIREG